MKKKNKIVGQSIFIGKLEDNWWKEDVLLNDWTEKGWVEIVPDEGFQITKKGLGILKGHGLHTSGHPADNFKETQNFQKLEALDRWERLFEKKT